MTEKKTKKKKIKSIQELIVYTIQDVFTRIGRFDLEPVFACTVILTFFIARSMYSFLQVMNVIIAFLAIWTVVIYWLEQSQVTPSRWCDETWWWTLDGWQFEREVGLVFKRMGYSTKVTRGSGDGGVDIIMHKNGLKYIVQCKHYKRPLGPEAVRSLYGVKEIFDADKLVMVASKGLTPASKEFIQLYKDVYIAYDLQDIIRMSITSVDKKKGL